MGLVEMGFERLGLSSGELLKGSARKVRQLAELDAPSDLVRTMKAAEAKLRRAFNSAFPELSDQKPQGGMGAEPATDLYQFALDNAVDGCFGELLLLRNEVETFSFLLDEAKNNILDELVRCATLHADACWEVHDWCLSQLSPQRGRNIRASQHEALQFLERGGLAPALLAGLGRVEHRIDGKTVAA